MTQKQQIIERSEDDASRWQNVEVISFDRFWGDGEWVATGDFRLPIGRVNDANEQYMVSHDDTHAVLRYRIASSFSIRVPETARELYLTARIGW